MKKVILISVDGMRPDGFLACGNPYIHEIMARAYYTLDARTVFPSVTLPCHMSMFHSVPPTRHGVTTNTYTPQVRPVDGLCEQIKRAGGVSAMFYGWEQIRDIARPGAFKYGEYMNCYMRDEVDAYLCDRALARIAESKPDFVFLYLVETDDKGGHDSGWMSAEYLRRVSLAVDHIRAVIEACGEEYTIVITADHGGHERSHGSEMDEDMIIPNFYIGPDFPRGVRFDGGSILDLAPTIARVMGVEPAREWEGQVRIG